MLKALFARAADCGWATGNQESETQLAEQYAVKTRWSTARHTPARELLLSTL